MDHSKYTYPSRRSVTFARDGMVATSVPLAAHAGTEILRRGGNAADAAVATAAALTVLEPPSNSLGSDCFALLWMNGKLHGLNASGRAPRTLDAQAVRDLGHQQVPFRGWIPVMVPGAPAGWAEVIRKFGKLTLPEVLAPAIRYAREGYPVPVTTADLWQRTENALRAAYGGPESCPPEFRGWYQVFAPSGHAPRAGELWRSEAMARTLERIAASNAADFYQGETARKLDAFSRAAGGWLRAEDLADYRPAWVDPIHTEYRGCDVYEMPPNGHGITVLMALNILKGLTLGAEKESVETYHSMIESLKLAYADAKAFVADPAAMTARVETLLSPEYAARRRAVVRPDSACDPAPGDPYCGDTVYLCTADGEGNMVSFIQSHYKDFGSWVVEPETGVELQNRGANFSLDPASPNCLAPGKKAYHTIIPGFLCRDGKALGPFGVMGGFMQPQGHLQVLVNLLDYHMNPQQALDAPRWQWTGGKVIQMEPGVPQPLVDALRAMGHEIEVVSDVTLMGRGEIILRDEQGVLCGASEPRCDGTVSCF